MLFHEIADNSLSGKLILTENLAPAGSPKALIDQLNELGPRVKNVLIVGHEPYLSRLIALLVTGNTTAALDLKKGGLAKLELKKLHYARCAMLAWLLAPKQLALMRLSCARRPTTWWKSTASTPGRA